MEITEEKPKKTYGKGKNKPLLQRKIDKRLNELDLTESHLLAELGYTKFGYDKMFAKNSFKYDVMKKIATFLNVGLTFFDINDEKNTKVATYGQNDHKLEISVGEGGGVDVWRDALVAKLETQIKELQTKEAFYMRTIDNLNENLKKH